MTARSRPVIEIVLALLAGLIAAPVFGALIPAVLNRGMIALCLVPVIAAFFLLMIVRPHIAIALILLFRAGLDPLIEKSRSGDQQMGLGAGINVIVILLTVFLAIRFKPDLKKLKFLLFWLAYLLICFCAVFYSPQSFRALRLFMNFVTYVSMAVLPFMLIQKPKDRFVWLKCLLAASIGPVVLGDYQLLRFHGQEDRVLGSFAHPNIFAFFMVLMIVIAFVLILSKEAGLTRNGNNVLKLYMANLFILLLATKTRNAWIACWLIFFIYGLKYDRKILTVTIIMPLLSLFLPAIQERVMDLFQGNDTSKDYGLNSFAWRKRLWMDSLPVIAKRPVEGHGLASFVPLSQTFSAFAESKGVGAHNTYLEILFETGLLGLTAFAGIWWALMRFFSDFVNKIPFLFKKEFILVFAYVISYAVDCTADNMNYYLVSNWYTWFFIGIMYAAALKLREEQVRAGTIDVQNKFPSY